MQHSSFEIFNKSKLFLSFVEINQNSDKLLRLKCNTKPSVTEKLKIRVEETKTSNMYRNLKQSIESAWEDRSLLKMLTFKKYQRSH